MIPISVEVRSFSETIDDWVVSAARDGATTFAEVVTCLPGVFPVDVLHSIKRTARFGEIPRHVALRLRQSVREKSFLASPSEHSILPVPHPLDYEWRFTQEAIEKLAEVAADCGHDVTFLGTPSVFTYVADNRDATHCTFVDRNPATLNVLRQRGFGRVVECDCLRDAVPQLKSGVVIADPPWYGEFLKGFLWMAAQLCRMDGFLIMSLPPDGTRPTAREDMEDILDYARKLGFALKQLAPSQLPYETPQFEKNVIRQAGILCELGAWRKGTLAVFQKEKASHIQRPSAPADEKWLEASLFGTRIKLLARDRLEAHDPRLTSIVEGDLLASVSRTTPIRRDVDVWTSGNRVFRCDGPSLLHRIIQDVADNSFEWNDAHSINRCTGSGRGTPIQQAATKICRIAYSEKCERQLIGNG